MRMLAAVSSLEKLPTAGVDADPSKPKEVAPFLRSLRRILDEEDRAILRWTPDGRAFEIHDMDRMMKDVLPKYFKHRKYTSFQRQLNYFNFKKWTKSKAVVCTFSNDSFLRDRPDLAWRITRKKSVHGSNKSGSAAPRKPKASAATATAKLPAKIKVPSIKLEPLSLKLQQSAQQHAVNLPLPTKSLWKRDMAIRVPRVPSVFADNFGPYGAGRSFPSPTDMDLMLLENDVEPQRYYRNDVLAALPLSEQEVDSLEWVDNFLPSLDAPRQEEPVFAGNTVNVSALLRQPLHYGLPVLQPAEDYSCMTTSM